MGGGASSVWCQIVADVFGVQIRQVRDPVQANARGAAWIAAAGLGEIAFADMPRLVEFDRISSRPRDREVYDARYRTYLESGSGCARSTGASTAGRRGRVATG